MRIEFHKAELRGKGDAGWLHSRFSFSFSDYYNPKRMGFGKLRVLNDDIIEPGQGFGAHSHANMEIITIVTEGELEHKDSTGVKEVIKTGEIQVMSAGKGIIHSEYNHSTQKQVKLFQIWIETKKKNLPPRHDKKTYQLPKNELTTVVSEIQKDNLLSINQNAKISLGKFEVEKKLEYAISENNGVFIFVIE